MTSATRHLSLRLDADPLRRLRYPELVWLPDAVAEVRPTPSGEHTLGVIFDDPARATALPEDRRLLLGLDVLAVLLEHRHAAALDGRDWLPLLPFEHSIDLADAKQRVTSGEVGSPRLVEVTVPLGLPPLDGWEADYPIAFSPLEALVYGMRIAELLTGAPIESSTWLQAQPPVLAVLHHPAGPPVVHRIIPADCAPIAGFEGEVVGDKGRLLLRKEFAPGAVGLWQRKDPGYLFPTLPASKHSVQAPDSARGGPELALLLRDLMTPSRHADELRGHAVRLVHHALRLLGREST